MPIEAYEPLRSGVPAPVVDRLVASGESKFTIVREVLAQLDNAGKPVSQHSAN